MVSQYVPDTGDIVFLDFDPQVGREQAKRRPALVLTDLRYNRASGLAVVCPLTSKVKPYPFSLPITVGSVEGAVLVRWSVEIGFADLQVDHAAALRFERPGSYQDIEGGFDSDAAHSFCEFHDGLRQTGPPTSNS